MKRKIVAIVLTLSMVLGNGLIVCAEPKTMEDGTVFDAEYYALIYPDVVSVFGTDENALYNHYVTYGKAEGRSAVNPNATLMVTDTESIVTDADNEFDAVYYALNNLDVLAAIGSEYNALYEHYVTTGKAEGRLGCAPTQIPVYTSQMYIDEVGTIYQTDEKGTLYITDSWGTSKYDLDRLNTLTSSKFHLMRYGWMYGEF